MTFATWGLNFPIEWTKGLLIEMFVGLVRKVLNIVVSGQKEKSIFSNDSLMWLIQPLRQLAFPEFSSLTVSLVPLPVY